MVEETIGSNGLRRGKIIGKEVECNFEWLEKNDGWKEIDTTISDLKNNQTKEEERKASATIKKNLKGLARNSQEIYCKD